MSLKFEIVKKNIDDPNFSESQGFFYDTRPPSSDDDDYVNSIIFGNNFMVYWWDQSANDIYQLTNWENTPLVWQKFVTDLNLSSSIANIGWKINTSRSYSNQSSLGFNVSRRPSLTNDTTALLSATLTNTLLTTATVTIEISSDNSTFVSIGTIANLTEAVSSVTYAINFIVPVGYYYKLVTSGSGTAILVNLQELSF